MSLRVRLAAVTTAVVALSVLIASITIFVSMRSDLLVNVDNELRDQAAQVQKQPLIAGPPAGKSFTFPTQHFGRRDYFQLVLAGGETTRPPSEPGVPVDSRTLAVAKGKSEAFFADATVAGVHARADHGLDGHSRPV